MAVEHPLPLQPKMPDRSALQPDQMELSYDEESDTSFCTSLAATSRQSCCKPGVALITG